jgi:acetyl-CoA carboxylase, biotin carboxylase subunit
MLSGVVARPFEKVLVANRGEIAVRIIRACREMGIGTVAVFSEADRESLHVQMADEAVPIGAAPPGESYLVIDRVVAAARQRGAEAIHPGYGFLAENATFAEACAEAGLVFVGPPAAAIRAMGDKMAARRAAIGAQVPIVPGTTEPISEDAEAERVAREVGYPVMVKAAMGGGGKGLRLVRQPADLASGLRMARSEAGSAFGDSSVYLERYLEDPRHIEIQVLADAHGSVVHLGERECSIQRRHQKLVEESPSPLADADLRRRMGEAACRLAAAVGYVNAGTVECLVDRDRRFYFLEMNTRLQVEHPVTEMVTGRDLVKEQLRLAAGEKLGYVQEDVTWRGWAIECRINAEDPAQGFIPSPGRITGLQVPGGTWVRDDSGVYAGWTVPRFYDTLLAKLVVWAPDRDAAVDRMARALAEYRVVGVRTTIPLLRRIMRDTDFRAGRLSTHFIDRLLGREYAAGSRSTPTGEPGAGPPGETIRPDRRSIALLAAGLAAYQRTVRADPGRTGPGGVSPWKLSGRPGAGPW